MKNLKYIVLVFVAAVANAQQPVGTFEAVGSYRGIGALVATAVAPGKEPGSERLYASYAYGAGSLDVLSIDPETGNTEVFHSPVAGESFARSFAVGPDGNLYIGTQPTAHLLKLDTRQRQLVDLGRPSAAEVYIWDVAFGSDKRLYGATFPRCKLVRYDPATGKMEDLGRMDPTEQYARSIVGSSDGFLYIGIGSSKANIAAYNIRTGEHREILQPDAQVTAIAKVFHGTDGNLYGMVGLREFRLAGWTVTELEPGHRVEAATANTLRDGRTLSLADKQGSLALTVTNPGTHETVERTISYHGQELQLMRIGFGPDGVLYGSTAVPMDLVKADIGTHRVNEIGYLGPGEVYSFLSHGQRLLMACYSGPATLMAYSPALPFDPGAKPPNPRLPAFAGGNSGWRPMAMIDGPGGEIYVGSVAGYGALDAPLIKWNPETDQTQQFNNVVPGHSILSLARWHDLVIGGTSVFGGEGSHATQTEARLFLWNPRTQLKEFEMTPVPGAPRITDLITAPNGLVYGVAGHLYGVGSLTLFVFDPESRKVIGTQVLPFSNPIYNSVAVGKDGRIWGLEEDGIFTIDPAGNHVEVVARPNQKITGGFALRDGAVYFISGATIYLYTM